MHKIENLIFFAIEYVAIKIYILRNYVPHKHIIIHELRHI